MKFKDVVVLWRARSWLPRTGGAMPTLLNVKNPVPVMVGSSQLPVAFATVRMENDLMLADFTVEEKDFMPMLELVAGASGTSRVSLGTRTLTVKSVLLEFSLDCTRPRLSAYVAPYEAAAPKEQPCICFGPRARNCPRCNG